MLLSLLSRLPLNLSIFSFSASRALRSKIVISPYFASLLCYSSYHDVSSRAFKAQDRMQTSDRGRVVNILAKLLPNIQIYIDIRYLSIIFRLSFACSSKCFDSFLNFKCLTTFPHEYRSRFNENSNEVNAKGDPGHE